MATTATASYLPDLPSSAAKTGNTSHAGPPNAPAAVHDGEDTKKGSDYSYDVQSVASAPYASSSKSPTFGNKMSAFGKKLSGSIMSRDEDVAYGNAILAGKSREAALEEAEEARRAQQEKFDRGVHEAKEIVKIPGNNTQPVYMHGAGGGFQGC